MMKKLDKSTWYQTVCIAFIIWVFSLTVRGYYFSRNIVFTQDQARDVMLMEHIVSENQWLIGYGPKVSVANFRLPPLYYYFHAIVFFFFRSPLSMSIMILVVESLTPVLLFLLFRKYFSTKAGIIAAFVHCVALIPVHYATFMWNPNLIPFFSTLALFSAAHYAFSLQKRWFLLLTFAIATSLNLHYQAFIMLPFYTVFTAFFFFRRSKDRVWILFSALSCLLIFIPYIIVEAQNNWQNTQEILLYFTKDHVQVYDRVSKPSYVLTFIPRFLGKVLFQEHIDIYSLWIGRFLLLGILTLFFKLFYSFWKTKFKDQKVYRGCFFIVYILLTIASTRLYRGDKLDYYLSVLYIFPALSIALAWEFLNIKKALFFGVFYLLLLNGWYFGKMFWVPENAYQNLSEVFQDIDSFTNGGSVVVIPNHPDLQQQIEYGYQHSQVRRATLGSTPDFVVHFCDPRLPCTALPRFSSKTAPTVENVQLQVEYTFTDEYRLAADKTYGSYRFIIAEPKK